MEKSFYVEDILIKGAKLIYSKDDNNENDRVNSDVSSDDTHIFIDKGVYVKGANIICD